MDLTDVNSTEGQTDLFGNLQLNKKVAFSKNKKIVLTAVVVVLMLTNLYFSYATTGKVEHDKKGDLASSSNYISTAYEMIFFALPIAAFILSFLVSLLPYRKAKYFSKYYPFAMIILIVLEGLNFLMLLLVWMGPA